jgi:hypothetical protein
VVCGGSSILIPPAYSCQMGQPFTADDAGPDAVADAAGWSLSPATCFTNNGRHRAPLLLGEGMKYKQDLSNADRPIPSLSDVEDPLLLTALALVSSHWAWSRFALPGTSPSRPLGRAPTARS